MRKKLGLALGSGGARGLSHIGVIKSLVKHNIKIDMIAGSSVGALIGGSYAATEDVEKMEKIAVSLGIKDLVDVFFDPMWKGGLVKGEKMLSLFRNYVGNVRIEDLNIPFGAVATNIDTAETVVIKTGELASAIRASSSIPVMFTPFSFGEGILVDGGISSPVPVETVRQMGADIVLAVNLDSMYFSQQKENVINGRSAMSVLQNSYQSLRYHLSQKEVGTADVVINPDIPYVNDLAFLHGEKLILGGEKATDEKIEMIKSLLG